MNETTELTIGLEETDYEFDFGDTEEGSPLDSVNELIGSETDQPTESIGEHAAESVAADQLTQAIEAAVQETSVSEATATTTEPEANTETESEPQTPPKVEAQEPSEKPKTPQDEIQALLNELRQRLAETELMEYARQQGRLIDVEIKKLNAAGVRVTEAEVRHIVQEAMQKGIEPVVYFKAYAADLLQNLLIFGEPLLSKPPVPGSERAVQNARRLGRPTLEERFRTKDGLIGLDYFVAEEIASAFDDTD